MTRIDIANIRRNLAALGYAGPWPAETPEQEAELSGILNAHVAALEREVAEQERTKHVCVRGLKALGWTPDEVAALCGDPDRGRDMVERYWDRPALGGLWGGEN